MDHGYHATVDILPVAGHCQGLDVANYLFCRFLASGKDVYLNDLAVVTHHAHGVNRLKSSERFLKLFEIQHGFLASRGGVA